MDFSQYTDYQIIDFFQHNIPSRKATIGSFDAGTINPGSTASAMIKGQGTVPYHCNIHPWMHGSLLVSN
jgi:plastocyanin